MGHGPLNGEAMQQLRGKRRDQVGILGLCSQRAPVKKPVQGAHGQAGGDLGPVQAELCMQVGERYVEPCSFLYTGRQIRSCRQAGGQAGKGNGADLPQ